MPTPFKDGEVDPAAIQGNVRRWMAAGLGGIVALGTNGEASLLDDDEGDLVVETVRHEVPDDRTLIVGAGRAGVAWRNAFSARLRRAPSNQRAPGMRRPARTRA